MQTSPVLNNILSVQAQATKANDPGVSPDSPNSFNQVLSREMADRKSVNEAPKTKEPDAKGGTQPAASGKAEETKPAGDSEAAAKDTDSTADEKNDAEAATNDMLALVTSLNQVNPAAQAAAQATTQATAATQETADMAVDSANAKAKPVIDAAGTVRSQAPRDRAIALASQETPQTTPTTLATTPLQTQPQQTSGKTDSAQNFSNMLDKANTQTDGAQDAAALKKAADASAPPAKSGQEVALNKESITVAAAKPEHLAETREVQSTAVPLQVQQQPAVNNLTHVAAAAQAGETLAPRVGTPAWDQALGQKVTWMIAGEQQSASLTLNPPDLGPLQVVLNVTNSHANATFVAAQPEVRQALEAAMPRLRDMLGEAGIQLGQATVSSGSNGQQNAFDQQQQSSSSARRMEISSARFDTPVQAGRIQPNSSGQGLVDTFV